MRTNSWVTAALAVALTAACKDRDGRHDNTIATDRAEQTTGQVRERADRAEDSTADEVSDAAKDAADDAKDAGKNAADKAEKTGKYATDTVAAAGTLRLDKTRDSAKDAGDLAKDAAKGAANTVEKAADAIGISSYSYERRDAFRNDVDHQLAEMDKELAGLRQGVNSKAPETYTQSVAAAEETRKAVGNQVSRLAGATPATWDQIQGDVRASLDSLNRQLQALRPDAKPMGGAGPS
jgi:hypothetical protein